MRPADTAQGEIRTQTHRVIGFLCCELATLVCGNVEVRRGHPARWRVGPRQSHSRGTTAPHNCARQSFRNWVGCSKSHRRTHLTHLRSVQEPRPSMGCELCWRVTSLSGDVVCTIYHDDEAVEVRAAFSDGIVVRTRRTFDIETGRIIASQWLEAIRGDFMVLASAAGSTWIGGE